MSDKVEKKEEKTEEKLTLMEFRNLGGTGLKVSCLGFGMMSFTTLQQSIDLMKAARPDKNGINFFDNAEFYGSPSGTAETLFGKALKALQKEDALLWRRSDLVITTKLFWSPADLSKADSNLSPYVIMTGAFNGTNEWGLNKKKLIESMKKSLKRLQLEYVDVVFAHRYDGSVPMKEIVVGFNELIKRGYAYYWGTSEWPVVKIVEAYFIAEKLGLEPPVVEQPQYNMFARETMKKTYKYIFESPYNIATTIWSPLASGYLTGKYCDESKLDKDNVRLGGKKNVLNKWFGSIDKEKVEKVSKLLPIAKKLNVSMTALALGWTLKNKNTTVVLLGGRKANQITQNLGAVKAATLITNEIMKEIDEVLGNKPNLGMTMVNQRCKKIIDAN